MNYKVIDNMISIPVQFDLDSTFNCGQCFRWNKIADKKWHAVANHHPLTITVKDDEILFENTTDSDFKNIWIPYFDLDFDYDALYNEFCCDTLMCDIVKQSVSSPAQSLHILRQEPWEALCSFVISQNNNIPRIKKIIESFCSLYGNKIGDDFDFPDYKTIATLSEKDLEPIKSGFRARYIIDAAKKLKDGEIIIEEINNSSAEAAKQMLMRIKGVGPKVADCTMLYGFHKLEAFPIDVWMKRAMTVIFPDETPESFGKYAGIAQQYIFSYSRMHPELFEKV